MLPMELLIVLLTAGVRGLAQLSAQIASPEEIAIVGCFRNIYARLGHFQTSLVYNKSNWIVDQLSAAIPVKHKVNKLENVYKYFTMEDYEQPPEFVYVVLDSYAEIELYKKRNNMYGIGSVHHLIIYTGNPEDMVGIFKHLKEDQLKTAKIVVMDRFNNFHRMQKYVDTCGEVHNKTIIGDCRNSSIDALHAFYGHPITNFMGCTIGYYAYNNSFDHYLLGEISKVHNFKTYVVDLRRTTTYDINAVNINFLEFLNNLNLHFDDYIYPYDKTVLLILVPKASKIPRWLNFQFAYEGTAWIAILATCCCAGIVYALAAKILNSSEDYVDVFMQIYSMVLFQGVRIPESISIKLLITFWLFFALIVTSAFAGLFYSQLFQQFTEKQIKTPKDIEKARLIVYGTKYGVENVFGADSPIARTYIDMFGELHPTEVIKMMEKNKTIAFSTNSFVLEVDHYFNKSVFEYLYVVPTLENSRLATLQRGHALTVHLNAKFRRVFEMGIFQKWKKDHMEKSKYSTDESVPLTMKHLQFPFFCLIFGLLLAALLFALEQYWSKQSNY